MSNQGAFKLTGNKAVDMVAACIHHYEKQGKKVAYIRLDKWHWQHFKHFVVGRIPGYDLSNGEIEFEDTIVTPGSSLQIDPMYFELHRPVKMGLVN